MVFQEMVPWRKGRTSMDRGDGFPLSALHRRLDRMFDDFFGDFGLGPAGAITRTVDFVPRMDVSETEKEYTLTAELAGIDDKDVDITLQDNVLTVRGEKKVERDEKSERCSLMERSYGTFSRSVALPAEVQEDKIEASFKNGVLTVRLPKTEVQQPKAKKIEIKSQ